MKEKIVSRTIKLTPDHTAIVNGIIEKYKESNDGYKDFLLYSSTNIKKIFLNSGTDNIRSLKCALQDFERFYQVIVKYTSDLNIKTDMIYNYLALVFEYKIGNLSEKKESLTKFLGDSEIKEKYKNYNIQYGNGSMRQWITDGNWDEVLFINELQEINNRMIGKEPMEILLDYRDLMLVDDNVLESGFDPLMKDAYLGKFDLNTYIVIFGMLIEAKDFKIQLPCEVNYSELKKGINIRMEDILSGKMKETASVMRIIPDAKIQCLGEEAKNLINNISKFRDELDYTANRHLVTTALLQKNSRDVNEWLFKYTGAFDVEYATNIAEYFRSSSNIIRRYIINDLEQSWQDDRLCSPNNIDISISGLTKLCEMSHQIETYGEISSALYNLLNDKILKTIKNYKIRKSAYESIGSTS